MKFFSYAFIAMFFYFFFPNYIFTALSTFNWLSWIAPHNVNLNTIVGMNNGIGINPLSTFDWNVVTFSNDPLQVPFYNTLNRFAGMCVGAVVLIGIWYTNAYYTAFLPLNTTRVYDHYGSAYNVSRVINDKGLYDAAKYAAYSPAYLSAGYIVVYIFYFASYTGTISYAWLNQGDQIKMGFRSFYNHVFNKGRDEDDDQYKDVHNKLMASYKEGQQA